VNARRALAAALAASAVASLLVGAAREAGAQHSGHATASREVYQGWKWFHVYCYRCHGTDAVSNTSLPGPDLRTSIKNLPREEFFKAVHEGRLPKGMPAWGQLLTEQQIHAVYAYVDARAQERLKAGRPDEQ
jgi:mono/diheme cytochrome c family protein